MTHVPATSRVARLGAVLAAVVRIRSCLAGAVATAIGGYLATGTVVAAPVRSVLAAVTVALLIAFANVVNDIVDIEVDAAGKPGRPIPAGRLTRSAAELLAAGLATAAVAVAARLGWSVLAAAAVLLAASYAYSVWLKGTVLLGNVVVAACAASPLLFGAAAVGRPNPAACVATALAFEFMLSYEVLKTMADRDGDAAVGLRTLATTTRARTGARVFGGLVVALSGTALAATAISSRPAVYLTVAVPILVGPVLYVLGHMRTALQDGRLWGLMRLMRRAWLLGTAVLWLVR